MALLGGHRSEKRRIDHSGRAVKSEAQVAAVVERPERVIEEIIRVEAELQLFALADVEILEQAEVGVEVGRSVDRWKHGGAVLADLRGEAEATRVDELMRPEIGSRVASENRHESDIRRAEQRGRANILS